MAFFLANDVSYGKLANTTVVLDLRRDRYVRLGAEAARALDTLSQGAPLGEAALPGLTVLINAGFVWDAPAGSPVAPVRDHVPMISALEVAPGADDGASLVQIGLTHALIRVSLARRGLASTVKWLRRSRETTVFRADLPAAVAVAQTYSRARRLLPGKPLCVPEAFTLSSLLTRRGIAHDVLFGVSLTPFAAHAWAQTDAHILSDRADSVRSFQPVFVL